MKPRHHIHSHPAMPGINPILAAAASLARLYADNGEPLSQEQAERDLDQQVMSVGIEDFSALEGMLAVQAHVLHAIFTRAVARAAEGPEEKAKVHMAVALKSQSYCRQTVVALARIRKTKDFNTNLFADLPKPRNELNRNFPYPPIPRQPLYKDSYHAPMDAGRTPHTGREDARVETLQEGRCQNSGG